MTTTAVLLISTGTAVAGFFVGMYVTLRAVCKELGVDK